VIEVKHLTKRYGNNTAVADLSFTIEKGRVYGFLGPNGAGKSTTMNIIAGCLSATEGQVLIGGYDIFEEPEEAKRRIGYLPELPPLYVDMTPREYLTFVAKAKGVAKKDRAAQLEYVIKATQLESMQDRLIRHLSKGYRQRVGVAQALLGNPEVIILDEPTVGLDPIQIIEIRDLIKKLGKTHTIILSSHILPEVRAICDQIMIISNGVMVANDTPDNLETLFGGSRTATLQVKASEEEAREIIAAIADVEKASYKQAADGVVEITITSKGEKDLREDLFFAFAEKHHQILEMSEHHASLEDVFLGLTLEDTVKAKPADAKKEKKERKFLKKEKKEVDDNAGDI